MKSLREPADLDVAGRLGWVDAPSPVERLEALGDALGLAWLGAKRDDRIEALHGGTKPRKLDFALAEPRLRDAARLASAGAIGSGSLVAITAAAARLGRRLEAHVFWTGLSAGVVDNLAFVASGPTDVRAHRSRVTLALTRPAVLLAGSTRGAAVIPPGATSPTGMLGLVRAGLELAEQVRAGELPEPDRIYVALGSGGTAVGLAVGLALAGLGTQVVGVGVVERSLSPLRRVRALRDALLAKLDALGFARPASPIRLAVDRRFAGAGYAVPSGAALDACDRLAPAGLALEPIYTGKAMAALLASARASGASRVLFWQTKRGALPPPDPAWRDRLPRALAHRLALAEDPARLARRRVILGLGALATAVGAGVRLTGYPALPAGFRGLVLAPWEAHVVRAAAEALVPPAGDAAVIAAVPARVDRYLVGMPPPMAREIHAMLALVEHGTLLGGRLARFTRLAPEERARLLSRLADAGGLAAQIYGGLRDLVFLAVYQQPATWGALGYEGPRVPLSYDPRRPGRAVHPAYEDLRARPDVLPKGIVR
jgi:D-cysteine desulfhydrase